MKKLFTLIGISLVTIATLLVLSAFLLSHYVNPNNYKGRISQYVYAKTGQVLVINGDMHWSVFPWIGLKANNLAYYNAPSFVPKTLITAKEMDIKVKLIPLIMGKIEVGNITLANATVNLIKNQSGQYNWQTINKNIKTANNENTANNHSLSKLLITSLKVKNSKLNWFDQQNNTKTFISDLNITSKHIQFGQTFPLTLQFNLLNNQKEKSLSVDMTSDMTLSNDYKKYQLQNLKFNGDYFKDNNKLALKAIGDLTADLNNQTALANLNFSLENMSGQLNLNGAQITKQPQLNGTLTLDDFNLKKLLQKFDNTFQTKNSDALTSVSLLSKIELTDNNLKLTQLHAKIDETDVFGKINVASSQKNVRFNLTVNKIVINDYLNQKAHDETSSKIKTDKDNKKPSPWSFNGGIKIANLATDKIKLSNLAANLDMHNNLIRILPLHANLYNGTLDGSIIIDKRQQNKTLVFLKPTLKNIDIKELLHEFSSSDKLSGLANLTADLTSTTDKDSSFLSALNGKLHFTLSEGSLKGVDVIYQLSRAHAFIKHLSAPKQGDSKQTNFASLTLDANVNNGVINSENLSLISDYLKVNGKGSSDLVSKDIHYQLNALAQPRLAEENSAIGKEITIYQVPIKVSGKLSKPSVNLDFGELAKNFYAKSIAKPISEQLEKNVNNLKESLKDEVKNKIKELSPGSLLNKLTGNNNSSDATSENDTQSAPAN